LAACGQARPPWQAASGLWLTTYAPEAGGIRSVICYAEGGPGDVFGDSRPASYGEMTCQPVQRRRTADGWSAEQSCALRGAPGLYRYEGRRTGGAITARTTIVDPSTRGPLAPPMDIRVERIGDCPQGWSPGEVMRLSPPDPDGRFRVILPGQNGAPERTRELSALPPELASRR
jgi:hypothetical protein